MSANNAPEPKTDTQYLGWIILGVVTAVCTVAQVAISAIKDLHNSGSGENNVK